ncbi:hypothetical protein LC607_33660 [Nostoc sp. CHAB 5824]|nr:hypothetical protein [Nostoc sp. CHAB 5824]
MRIKFFEQRIAWFIVGLPVVFGILLFIFQTVIQPKIKQADTKAKILQMVDDTKAVGALATRGTEKLKEFNKLNADYKACVLNVMSKPGECDELATKSRLVFMEVQQISEEMNGYDIKSYQSLCDLDPKHPQDYCGKVEELKRKARE